MTFYFVAQNLVWLRYLSSVTACTCPLRLSHQMVIVTCQIQTCENVITAHCGPCKCDMLCFLCLLMVGVQGLSDSSHIGLDFFVQKEPMGPQWNFKINENSMKSKKYFINYFYVSFKVVDLKLREQKGEVLKKKKKLMIENVVVGEPGLVYMCVNTLYIYIYIYIIM